LRGVKRVGKKSIQAIQHQKSKKPKVSHISKNSNTKTKHRKKKTSHKITSKRDIFG
jgi:hypothetical protein